MHHIGILFFVIHEKNQFQRKTRICKTLIVADPFRVTLMSSLQRALISLPPPAPSFRHPKHSMCSLEECLQREIDHEVSAFECTASTTSLPPFQRQIDASLAVSKYRRSAAGALPRTPRDVLSLDQYVWPQLRHIVCHQSVHPGQIHSLIDTLAFVDDRVRALQVDLVVLQQRQPRIQLQLTRYHLLELYLLCQAPPKRVERTFIQQALGTALTAYWNKPMTTTDAVVGPANDEILCYTALCQVGAVILSDHENVGGAWTDAQGGYSFILQHHRHNSSQRQCPYPNFKFALDIASAAHAGFYRQIMVLLKQHNSPFHIVCRLCLAPALTVIRFQILNQFNKAYMKRESVSCIEMARLLFLPSAQVAVDFCVACGIPFIDNKLILKAVTFLTPPTSTLTRQEDEFVFGHSLTGRTDQDGIFIPSPDWIKTIILNEKC